MTATHAAGIALAKNGLKVGHLRAPALHLLHLGCGLGRIQLEGSLSTGDGLQELRGLALSRAGAFRRAGLRDRLRVRNKVARSVWVK